MSHYIPSEILEYGKYFFKDGSSDYEELAYTSRMKGNWRKLVHALDYPSQSQFNNTFGNYSVASLPFNGSTLVFVQIQRRREGEFTRSSHTNRFFNQIRFTVLGTDNLLSSFSTGYSPYSDLLLKSNPNPGMPYKLRDYTSSKNEISGQDSKVMLHFPDEIENLNTELVPCLWNAESDFSSSLYVTAIQHISNELAKGNKIWIISSHFNFIDRLLIAQDVQRLILPARGFVSFQLSELSTQSVDFGISKNLPNQKKNYQIYDLDKIVNNSFYSQSNENSYSDCALKVFRWKASLKFDKNSWKFGSNILSEAEINVKPKQNGDYRSVFLPTVLKFAETKEEIKKFTGKKSEEILQELFAESNSKEYVTTLSKFFSPSEIISYDLSSEEIFLVNAGHLVETFLSKGHHLDEKTLVEFLIKGQNKFGTPLFTMSRTNISTNRAQLFESVLNLAKTNFKVLEWFIYTELPTLFEINQSEINKTLITLRDGFLKSPLTYQLSPETRTILSPRNITARSKSIWEAAQEKLPLFCATMNIRQRENIEISSKDFRVAIDYAHYHPLRRILEQLVLTPNYSKLWNDLDPEQVTRLLRMIWDANLLESSSQLLLEILSKYKFSLDSTNVAYFWEVIRDFIPALEADDEEKYALYTAWINLSQYKYESLKKGLPIELAFLITTQDKKLEYWSVAKKARNPKLFFKYSLRNALEQGIRIEVADFEKLIKEYPLDNDFEYSILWLAIDKKARLITDLSEKYRINLVNKLEDNQQQKLLGAIEKFFEAGTEFTEEEKTEADFPLEVEGKKYLAENEGVLEKETTFIDELHGVGDLDAASMHPQTPNAIAADEISDQKRQMPLRGRIRFKGLSLRFRKLRKTIFKMLKGIELIGRIIFWILFNALLLAVLAYVITKLIDIIGS